MILNLGPALLRGLFFMKTILILLVTAFIFTQCTAQEKDSSNMQKKPIEQVLKNNREMLLAVPGVQGFYQGELENGSACIVIMVDSITEANKGKFPDSLEGYPVKVEEGGRIKPLYREKKE
jgi:hypothetical protein